MKSKITVTQLDSYLGLGLSIVAAVLTALNLTTFKFDQPWHSLIEYGLPALAAFAIAPITSEKLDTLLHLSGKEVAGLSALVGIGIAAVQTFGWPTTTVGIITGVLTLLGGVLFGTAAVTVTPAPAPVPTPVSSRRR
jgi:hypothetical protein